VNYIDNPLYKSSNFLTSMGLDKILDAKSAVSFPFISNKYHS